MFSYRVYVLEEGNRIKNVPQILECQDDAEAILRAQELLADKPIEIWEGARIVKKIKPDQ